MQIKKNQIIFLFAKKFRIIPSSMKAYIHRCITVIVDLLFSVGSVTWFRLFVFFILKRSNTIINKSSK